MSPEQTEITISLIGEAKTQREVYDAVKDLFFKIDVNELKKLIKDNWDLTPKLHNISLRKMNYKEKYAVIIELLQKKDAGQIKTIHLYLRKEREKGVDLATYNAVVKHQLPGREKLLGQRVKLIGLTKDRIRIEVCLEVTFFRHEFTIWDINCCKAIEILY